MLDALHASLLENVLVDKGAITASKETKRVGNYFQWRSILQIILRPKNNIKIKPNLMVFIQGITYLKYKMQHM